MSALSIPRYRTLTTPEDGHVRRAPFPSGTPTDGRVHHLPRHDRWIGIEHSAKPPISGTKLPRDHEAAKSQPSTPYQRRVYAYTLASFAVTAVSALTTAAILGAGVACLMTPAGLAVAGVGGAAVLLLAAAYTPRKYLGLRQITWFAAAVSLGIGLGVMVAASPAGALMTAAAAMVLLSTLYIASRWVPLAVVAQWNKGAALSLRLALNAGGAVAICLVPASPILLAVAAGAGLLGFSASALMNLAAINAADPSTDQDALSAAIELYVNAISVFTFGWRFLYATGAAARLPAVVRPHS